MGRRTQRKKQRRANRAVQTAKGAPEAPAQSRRSLVSQTAWATLALAVLSTLLVFAIYRDSLGGPFIFDDRPNIELNESVRLSDWSLEGLRRAAFDSPIPSRPVSYVSFALNYWVHEYRVFGYRVVNIVIHLVTGLLLFLLLETTLGTPALAGRNGPKREIALFAALLWLVHPLAVQSVAYVVQRMTSLATLFYVLSLLFYARARLAQSRRVRWGLLSGCLVSAVLAMGSKEIAGTLPVFILLYEWYFFQDLDLRWLKRRSGGLIVALLATAVVVAVFLGNNPLERVLGGYATRDFTLIERLLTELRVVVYYLSLLVFPHPSRLNLDYDFALSTSLFSPLTTLFSLLSLMALVAVAVSTARRQRLLSFALLWFLGNLVIESSVIALEIIFEHRTYLPSTLLILTLVAFLYELLEQKWARRGILAGLMAVCSLWTYQRANFWGDDLTLWRDVVAKSSGKPRPHHNLGVVLRNRERLPDAIRHFREAVRLDPEYVRARQNLGDALLKTANPAEALAHFSKAAALEPDNTSAHLGRAHALSELERPDAAVEVFQEVLRLEPRHVQALSELGGQLVVAGRDGEAIDPLFEALRLDPDHVNAHYNLGLALAEEGRTEEAIEHLRRAANLDASHALARRNLGVLLFNRGDVDEAVESLAAAVRMSPGDASGHHDLGFALLGAGRPEGAAVEFREALRLDPSLTSAQRELDKVLRQIGESRSD